MAEQKTAEQKISDLKSDLRRDIIDLQGYIIYTINAQASKVLNILSAGRTDKAIKGEDATFKISQNDLQVIEDFLRSTQQRDLIYDYTDEKVYGYCRTRGKEIKLKQEILNKL